MTRSVFRLTCLLACFAIALPLMPQAMNEGQGHPLKGVWLGDWGMNPDNRTFVTILMDWDGNAVTGSIDPGPNAIPFREAALNHENWTVHLEAESGGLRYVIDGQIEDLGSPRRSIVGRWSQGDQTGDFRITRQ